MTPEQAEFFETRIRPVLATNCFSCHGPKQEFAGLRLDTRARLLKGGEKGPVVKPGDPGKSALIQAIGYTGKVKMPPPGKLPEKAIADLTAWVKMGAPWPAADAVPKQLSMVQRVASARETHWAFQPVRQPPLPKVKNRKWVANPVDQYLLARMEAKKLQPSPRASRHALIRRAYFDLIGLPPTPAEVAAFFTDRSPNAYAKVIDHLLASPHYGERWGRHWLDVARYADTVGYLLNQERRMPYSYTYRDYVVRAFNEDKPYDQFIMQQIAADQMELKDKRDLAAMGFLTVGRTYLNNRHEIIDDQIDVVTRGFQAMTLSCARCHDHKYDPMPTEDYYSLYGVFAASRRPKELPLIGEASSAAAFQEYQGELKELETKRAELRQNKKDDEAKAVTKQIATLTVEHPGAPPRAMVLEDVEKPGNPKVFLRGNPGARGDEVPRQYLWVLEGEDRQPFSQGSGRLEMARKIASRENPLTARVMVNRVWMHHFGVPLVASPSNFGLNGEQPTHPKLLDFLAVDFMENGWSIKQLHRVIMLSNAYQQSSTVNARKAKIDPANTLYWRMHRRRLDFEQLRDSLLFVAGQLDRTVGGKPALLTGNEATLRRTLYGFIDRQNLPNLFRTFDFADPNAHAPMRPETTVPQQGLYLLNSPFVQEQARRLAARPSIARQTTPEARIRQLYRVALSRSPTKDETALGREFLLSLEGDSDAPMVEAEAWQYGYGEFDNEAKRLKTFTALPHFTGKAWQGGEKLPDPKLGWVTVSAAGGHPGNDLQHSAIRRWVALRDGVLSIRGTVQHGSDEGDGVRALIVSSRTGLAGEWSVHNGQAEAKVDEIRVQKGDTIDFILECRSGPGFDSFNWSPTITPKGKAKSAGPTEWSARADFSGPPEEQPQALTPWETYAQALLLTNEFLYID